MNSQKIFSREKIAKIIEKEKKNGNKIGITRGEFDLMHVGHIRYLQAAKKKCDLLVVGVNSDESVKLTKGLTRPIMPEKERMEIVSAIECVDFVFVFDEPKNLKNIQILKPNYYIKGGDYHHKPLTSAPELEKQGGKVILIPFIQGRSTTSILEKIKSLPESSIHHKKFRRAVFLDRDGTVIEEADFLKDPSKVKILPGVIEGMKKLEKAGFGLIMVTNQAGIGMGYLTEKEFFEVDRAVRRLLSKQGVMLDKVYYCPHNFKHNCPCQKPKSHFADKAAEEFGIILKDSFMVGDKTVDTQFGKNAGMKSVIVGSGKKGLDGEYRVKPNYLAKDFLDAAEFIISQAKIGR